MAMELDRVRSVLTYYRERMANLHVLPHELDTEFEGNARLRERLAYVADFIDRAIDLIEQEPSRREKIMRWYGFIQGALYMCEMFTVAQLKDHSNPAMPPPALGDSR